MSTHHQHDGMNFIEQISNAYSALQREPTHLATIDELQRLSIRDGNNIARLELRVQELKAREEELHARLRSVEAERDDAGFRLLEAEDKLDVVRKALGVAPPAAPVATPELPPELPQQPDVPPVSDSSSWATTPVATPEVSVPVDPITAPIPDSTGSDMSLSVPPAASTSIEPIGEAPQADPTVPTGQAFGPATVSTGDADSQSSAYTSDGPVSEEHSSGKYAGRFYMTIPGYIPRSDWLAGGGTNETYDWRPGMPHPDAA